MAQHPDDASTKLNSSLEPEAIDPRDPKEDLPPLPPPTASLHGPLVTSVLHAKAPTRKHLRSFQKPQPWSKVKISWFNMLFNLGTYALLMSDIMRSGTKAQLKMRFLANGFYAYFGSFAYEVITFTRDPNDLRNLTATKKNAPVKTARIWSYTYDTTSTGLRTLTRMLNSSDNSTGFILNCMNYQSTMCNHTGLFNVPETFAMLDQVADYVERIPDETIPAIHPPSPLHDYQYLRLSGLMKARQIYIVYDRVMQNLLNSFQIRSLRVSRWPRVNANFDVCADRRDRPFLCDAGVISDYRYTADLNDAESSKVSFIWVSVNDHVRATYNAFHNATNNVSVEVTVVEGYTEPLAYTGGLATTIRAQFEIVVLTRVRDCSRRADQTLDACRTIKLIDYRYEGGTFKTDLRDWDHFVVGLRVFAQGYFIVRIMALLVGCYFGFPPSERSWVRAMVIFLSEVPGHVIAFGSFLPIVLYVVALGVDGPAVNAMINSGGLGMQGSFMKDPAGVYRLICLLMRRQWVMAMLAMIWRRLVTVLGHLDDHAKVPSIRGHIFGLVAAMSMANGLYHPSLRDTRVMEFARASCDASVISTRLTALNDSNRRISGIYSDLFAISLSAAVYVAVMMAFGGFATVLVLLFRRFQHSPSVSPVRRGSSAMGNLHLALKEARRPLRWSFFFAQADLLPTTCGTLWALEGLTCSWDTDFYVLSVHRRDRISSADYLRRITVMNIVQLTEPLNYLRIRFGLKDHKVYLVRDIGTMRTFRVVKRLGYDHLFSSQYRANPRSYEILHKEPAHLLSFDELVHCQ